MSDQEVEDDVLPPLPFSKNASVMSMDEEGYVPPPSFGRRTSSASSGRRMSKTGSYISTNRRLSQGTQRLINDFMSAAGLSSETENISSITEKKLDIFAPNFVPFHVQKFCNQRALMGQGPDKLEPLCRETFGAVVMVDVSGYSKLSAALAEMGPIGSEILSKSMKGYLDKIIATIIRHGGQIVKFAGDAVISYWRSDANDSSKDIHYGEIVLSAAQCCLDLLTKYGTYELNIKDCATKMLRIHLGIGAGPIYENHVGGPPGRWEFFISGDGVNQLGTVLDLAKAGELALSHQALKYFSIVVDIDTVNIGNYDKRCIILTGLEKARRKVPQTIIPLQSLPELDRFQSLRYQSLLRLFMDQTALFKIQADIKQSQLFGLNNELMDLLDLIELRQVSTVFIRIGDLQRIKGKEILTESQKAIQVVQNALAKNEGALRQIHVDDKGAVILCFFGLPPMAHENDSSLALKAALEIKDAFLDLFEEFSLGVTTGIVAFGGVGVVGRTEYAVMGDSINMAARLMCHPEAAENMLCDEKTYNLCKSQFQFNLLGETKVKGKSAPISIFRPLEVLKENDKKSELNQGLPLIGRVKERNAIRTIIGKYANKDIPGIMMIEADGGHGLNTLFDVIRTESLSRNCICISSFGTEIERKTPLYCFRSLLNDLVSLVEISTKQEDGTIRIIQKEVPKLEIATEIAPWEEPSAELVTPVTPISRQNSYFSTNSSTSSLIRISSKRTSIRTSLNIPNLVNNLKFGKNSIIEEELESGKAVAALAEAPAHATSKRRTASQDLFHDGDPDKINHAEMQRKALGDLNLEFYARSKAAIDKIGGSLEHGSVLNLVMPSVFGDQDATMMSRKLRLKELCDIIRKLINAISESNFLVLCFQEAQYMDSLSWELLNEILSSCPKLCVFIGTRLLVNYDDERNRNLALKIKGLSRTSFSSLSPFSIDEANQLILSTWSGSDVVKVEQKLLEYVFNRSDGRPLFIRSLVLSLKESGNFRILPDGTLTFIGELDLGLSFDDRNIVVSEFDKLERTFQLFLKVAAVIGQSFALEDVLYFLTGMPGLLGKIETNNIEALISGVEGLDRYGFLQRSDDGLTFSFKSSVVRQFVYSLMVVQQRQQLHIKIARYLESKLNQRNSYELLVPIYEHYMESGDLETGKKLYYLELVAQYHFENESMADSIKCYRTLLNLTKDQSIGSNILSSWHRELGCALFYLEIFEEAEVSLVKSLELLNTIIPPVGIKLEWEIKRQATIRQKYEKDLPQGTVDEDYIESYPDFVGSGLSLNTRAKAKGPSGFSEKVSSKVGELLSIIALSDLYVKMGALKQLKLLILMGLNLCEEMPKDSIYCRLMSLHGYMTYVSDNNFQLAAKYIEIAEKNDFRNNITDSIEIVRYMARFLFLSGNWAHSKKKFDALDHLGHIANDLTASREAICTKSVIFFFGNSRPSSVALANELLNLGAQEDDWISQYWGSFLLCSNLLSREPNQTMDLLAALQKHDTVWNDAPAHLKTSNLYVLCTQGLQCLNEALYPTSKNLFLEFLDGYAEAVENLNIEHWISFVSFHNVFLACIFAQLKQGLDANSRNIIIKVCDAIHKHTKGELHNCILAEDYKHFYKGLKAIFGKKQGDAMHAWHAGAETEGKTDSIYIHGCFHALLGKFHDKKSEAEKHLKQARNLLTKVGIENELGQIWQL